MYHPRIFIQIIILFACLPTYGQLRLAGVFGDGMVLQRSKPIVIWGWCEPGEEIQVKLRNQQKSTTADSSGKWLVKLDPENADGPYTLSVKGSTAIKLTDVLIGDVWICAGQSNMQFTVSKTLNASQEIAAANCPTIRQLKIPVAASVTPITDISNCKWNVCSPKTVGAFTAVGYFFARRLNEELKIPIGIINISRGGTNVESWIRLDAFRERCEFADLQEDLKKYPVEKMLVGRDVKSLINGYPGLVFNAMVNPVLPMSVKGVVWYQGAANIGRAYQYRESFALLISDWRKIWEDEHLPFYFVQLPGFKGNNGNSNSGSKFAELRESQTKVLALPNTGMAVTTDLGDPDDIHPKNKRDVGLRLAALALHGTYGRNTAYAGPSFERMVVNDNIVWISFQNAEGGLTTRDSATPGGFEIAGVDGIFHLATGTIQGNRIRILSKAVDKPVSVRYGWADDTSHCNLFNKAGFPAVPFRTDDRMGLTDRSRYRLKP